MLCGVQKWSAQLRILISLDFYRTDFIQLVSLPNFDEVMQSHHRPKPLAVTVNCPRAQVWERESYWRAWVKGERVHGREGGGWERKTERKVGNPEVKKR